MEYGEFLKRKVRFDTRYGHTVGVEDVNPILKPHQKDIVVWAVTGGRRAIFASFGLGKSVMQLEILRLTLSRHQQQGARALIVCPLGVRQEFLRDAAMLGIRVRFIRCTDEVLEPYTDAVDIYLTNYESVREGKIDVDCFTAVSLDEASVLRSFGSKTYQTFLTLFDSVPYRFVATATPSPNRYKELIHYAGFLGVMDTGQALAQPLTANVLTPRGWATMADLKLGDQVIARNGQPTDVVGVYPQGEKLIYRVEFSDGTATRCTGDHLWLTRTQYQRNAATKFGKRNPGADGRQYWTTKTTDEIAATLRCSSTGSKNHEVPLVEPVQLDHAIIDIDPYLLGFLLGEDGHLRKTSVNFTTADSLIADEIDKIVRPLGLFVRKNPHKRADGQPNYDYSITAGHTGRTGRGHESNAVLRGLRSYELLGKRAWEKSIPFDYMFNTPEVRLAVLQGLMDADGTISNIGQTNLSTTSRQLADDAMFIARSLGGTATITTRPGRTPRGGVGRVKYCVTLRLPNGIRPFRLPRKVGRIVSREKYPPRRFITAVKEYGYEEAQCIAVADAEHLYVTDDFIVTHNTRFFQRDSTKANELTLYPHKEREFHLWLNTWAIFLQRPSDLGYSDDGYTLPELDVRWHEINVNHENSGQDRDGQGFLFRGGLLSTVGAAREKRDTMPARVARAAALVAESPTDHFILWHDLEDERRAITRAIPEATEVFGALDLDVREQRIADFADGRARILATKPSLSGSGCNLQRHCHRAIFVGVGFSFNDFIQSIHRIHRYLQTNRVRIDIIYAESEREVVKVLRRKWSEHKELTKTMSEVIREYGLKQEDIANALQRSIGVERIETSGNGWLAANNDCVPETRSMEDNSVSLIVTSIPFSNHYEYTPAVEDFGHTDDNAHFWEQMDHLTPQLLRVLQPGRIYACHVKDRIMFGNVTGTGVPTVSPFHAEAIFHAQKHGFDYFGMITVVTDVVRENNQTYRLGWSEQCKDGSKMGVGSPEYVLLFHKPQSDRSKGYADTPVTKPKTNVYCTVHGYLAPNGWPHEDDDGPCDPGNPCEQGYSRARWQVDAHAFWRSSGDRFLTADELGKMRPDKLSKVFTEQTLREVYDYESHIQIGETLDGRGALPSTFMTLAPGSWSADVWHGVNRMFTLNTTQSQRAQQLHICPLQIDIVDRLITRYSNHGDLVYDPFGGLMTVPVRALRLGRRGRGVELNPGYYFDGVKYLQAQERHRNLPSLFDIESAVV